MAFRVGNLQTQHTFFPELCVNSKFLVNALARWRIVQSKTIVIQSFDTIDTNEKVSAFCQKAV